MQHSSKRSVETNLLVSTDLPRLRVQIDSSLPYLDNLSAIVTDEVQIDNYFFVDQDANGNIQRVLYFQFESALPDSEHTFDYLNLTPITLNEQSFGYDGGVRQYRESKIKEQLPDSDVRKTVDFLKQHNLTFGEGEFYCTLRFVHQPESSSKNDVLIIYLERVQEADVPSDVIAKSRYSDEWQPYCDQLLARALRTFTICQD